MNGATPAPELLADRHEGLLTLTLNRPAAGNALSAALVEALLEQTAQAWRDDRVHTVLLRGAGKHFCTGFDLSDLTAQSDGDLLHRFVRIEMLLAELWHAPKRTIALAHGRTWGAGADVVAACELRAMLPHTRFRFPGARFGLVLGTRRLAERIGEGRARRWVASGHEADAAEALASGLIDETVQADAVEDRIASWVQPAGIDALTGGAIRAATRVDRRHTDLALLVASAARPGLRERILAYLQESQKQ